MLHVSSYLSAVSSSCAGYVEANSDIAEMENSDRHWFSDHLGDGKVMTRRHCKFREPIYVHNTSPHKFKSMNVDVVCCAVLNKPIHQQFVL